MIQVWNSTRRPENSEWGERNPTSGWRREAMAAARARETWTKGIEWTPSVDQHYQKFSKARGNGKLKTLGMSRMCRENSHWPSVTAETLRPAKDDLIRVNIRQAISLNCPQIFSSIYDFTARQPKKKWANENVNIPRVFAEQLSRRLPDSIVKRT